MTKPEDIPQRVWDEARACVPDYVKTSIKETIARAIMAAEKREREACAALCGGLRHPDQSAESEDWVEGTFACQAAILNRRENQGD